MTYREVVLVVLQQVLVDKGVAIDRLSDDQVLGRGGLGLDSLDMATLLAEMDARTSIDPFADGTPTFRTVGELIRLFDTSPTT